MNEILRDGSLPACWIESRFKYVATVKSNLVAPTGYEEYPQISPDNIEKNSGRLLSYNTVEESGVISGNHLFFEGQLLYSKIRPNLNKVTVAPFSGLCSADMYPIEAKINTQFLLYQMLSDYFVEQVSVVIQDRVKMPKINQDELGRIRVILPLADEQRRIAAFLDAKCAEIDALSADIQSEIETLEAYRRSVITEAVTKGLDKNVPMEDSGIGWVGKIPMSWNVGRIGSLYSLRNTKVSDKDYPPLSVTMKGIVPQLDSAAKTNAHDDRKLVKVGDFAINSRSDRRGSCGISKYEGSVSLINTVLAPKETMNPEYYDWLFHTVQFADEFYKWGHGIVDDLWTTGWQDMKRILIPVPPLLEQESIASYLNEKCAEIDFIIAQKQEQLAVLADYKKSLIYEYVTGKKEM